jgi:hypothetical protein
MIAAPHSLAAQERLIMARLARLFRAERHGVLARRPAELVAALLQRRGRCIETLMRLDEERRRRSVARDPALTVVATELAAEVEACLRFTSVASQRLGAAMRALRGEGQASGVAGLSSGTVLGRG